MDNLWIVAFGGIVLVLLIVMAICVDRYREAAWAFADAQRKERERLVTEVHKMDPLDITWDKSTRQFSFNIKVPESSVTSNTVILKVPYQRIRDLVERWG